MAILAVTNLSKAGVLLDGAAADVAGDEFPNTGSEMLFIKNGGAAPINVTLDVQATLDGQAVTDPVVAVGVGESKLIGPFPTHVYNDANKRAKVTYSAVASVLVKVVKAITAG